MKYIVLKAFAEYAERSKVSINAPDEEEAGRIYIQRIQDKFFRAWKKEIQQNRKRHVRSKLYAIFSAWKFYIKERTLLKMYLKESNIMQDPSLMSTIELKENYARISGPRSFF